MLKLKDEALHTFDKASPVALLDWYDVPKELILVMERPIPAMDMLDFIESKGGTLQEDETKVGWHSMTLNILYCSRTE